MSNGEKLYTIKNNFQLTPIDASLALGSQILGPGYRISAYEKGSIKENLSKAVLGGA